MEIVTCIGFHDTGSSAVDDYFREFSCFSQGGYEKECRLLQDPDGISDLEYNLVENPHRLNSGYALKRFRLMCKQYKRVYINIFGKDYMRLIDNYISDLTKLKYKGYWHGDVWLLKPVDRYVYWAKRVINKVLNKLIKRQLFYNYLPHLYTYHCCISEEEFLKKTRVFMNGLCKTVAKNNEKYVLLDQLVHPNNIARYLRYVEKLKVVIVDRDPRDVYIEQLIRKRYFLPRDAYEFCTVYRDSRKMTTNYLNCSSVLFVRFEDLVYKYNETTKKLRDFIGVGQNDHTKAKSRFNPEISIKNTRLWEKYPEYAEAVSVIERELPEFLYKYHTN